MRLNKRNKKRVYSFKIAILCFCMIIVCTFVVCIIFPIIKNWTNSKTKATLSINNIDNDVLLEQIGVKQDFLTINEYSRPAISLDKVNNIVVHYTANPNTDAASNRSYFEGLKDSKITSASSHFIIGLKGDIIQCIPLNEIAYASNDRNSDTISIECCHKDETGKFTDDTYNSLVTLTATLCKIYGLSKDDIIRHYDITGKNCPLYYVNNPDEWDNFKNDVTNYINK